MISNRSFFLDQMQLEAPVFMKVFHAMPEAKMDYRPDSVTPSAEMIIKQMVDDSFVILSFLDKGMVDFSQPHQIEMPMGDWIKLYENNYNTIWEKTGKVDDESWETKKVRIMMADKLVKEDTMMGMFWMVFHDLIHHRGQLSGYIRSMGGKVPSVYGPSADDPGFMTGFM